MSSLPLYSDVDTTLANAGTAMSGAESHGLLCGMLCAGGSCDMQIWRGHVIGDETLSSVSMSDLDTVLADLYRTTQEQINDSLMGFYLLLPDEDDRFTIRVNALAAWCQGYVLGLAEGGVSRETALPDNSDEILKDLINISRSYVDDTLESDEADEEDYMEIVEYVRTSVLVINEELQPVRETRTIQ